MNEDKELTAAIDLVIQHLTDANAHTIATLLEWQHSGKGDHDLIMAAYDAARQVLAAKND